MYAQFRVASGSSCLVLPPGTSAVEGASSFVNPLTALGMIETMRREGHSGLVHTAAASNLGQMLVKLCLEEHVPLVTIVRKPEQVELLRSIGAAHVCDSSLPSFIRLICWLTFAAKSVSPSISANSASFACARSPTAREMPPPRGLLCFDH